MLGESCALVVGWKGPFIPSFVVSIEYAGRLNRNEVHYFLVEVHLLQLNIVFSMRKK